MKKLALIYWPKGGSVERCAEIIKNRIENCDVDLLCLDNVKADDLNIYDSMIFGGSTVGADYWSNDAAQDQWVFLFSEFDKKGIDFSDKKAAVFGLGNQLLYPGHFVDGMKIIKENLEKTGMSVVGEWPTDGYDFKDSQAVENDKFVGLALDEDCQPELTNDRIAKWLEQLKDQL